MNNEARKLLQQIINAHGQELIRNPQRLNALFRDYAQGDYKREIFLCVQAVREGVVYELQNSSHLPLNILTVRMVKQLCDDCGIDPLAASWTVESWLLALNIITETSAIAILPIQHEATPELPDYPVSAEAVKDQPTVVDAHQQTKTLDTSSWLTGFFDRKSTYLNKYDGTVIDQRNGLQWQRFCLGQSWNGKTTVDEAKEYCFQDALNAVTQLNSDPDLSCGYNNWRIPNYDELNGIREKSTQIIDDKAFPNTPNGRFWTSTEDDATFSTTNARKRFYTVNFNRFNAHYAFGTARGSDLKYVRLVRVPG
jgi:hypothetical protein